VSRDFQLVRVSKAHIGPVHERYIHQRWYTRHKTQDNRIILISASWQADYDVHALCVV